MRYEAECRKGIWVVVDEAGTVVASGLKDKVQARAKAGHLAKAKRAEARSRACMCCRASFPSEGPYNRLCVICRRRDGSGIVGDPGGRVATSRSRA